MTAAFSTPAEIANALRTIAAALDTVTDPNACAYVSLAIQPHGIDDDTDEQRIAVIDQIANAVIGKPGAYNASTSHHAAGGRVDGLIVDVYQAIESQEKRALRREIEELRRQRDELAATAAAVPVAIPYVPDPDPLPGQHSIPHSVDPYELAAGAEIDQ